LAEVILHRFAGAAVADAPVSLAVGAAEVAEIADPRPLLIERFVRERALHMQLFERKAGRRSEGIGKGAGGSCAAHGQRFLPERRADPGLLAEGKRRPDLNPCRAEVA